MTSKTLHLATGITLPSVRQTANYKVNFRPYRAIYAKWREWLEDFWRDY